MKPQLPDIKNYSLKSQPWFDENTGRFTAHVVDVSDEAKIAEKYPDLAGLLYDEMADGGRAGYNVGGQAMMPAVAEADEDQVENLSFTELRARLPQSIDNDIVQVIANSKQALLDFANIRDQQDVEEFNQRYNVSLNIAQEG